MGCIITFNGIKYPEQEFYEKIKDAEFRSNTAVKSVYWDTQIKFEEFGVSPETLKKYRPIVQNRTAKIFKEIKNMHLQGQDLNTTLFFDIMKMFGVVTKHKLNGEYFIKSQPQEFPGLLSNKKTVSGAAINQPEFFVNKQILEFISEFYPNLVKVRPASKEKKVGYIVESTGDFTSIYDLNNDKLRKERAEQDRIAKKQQEDLDKKLKDEVDNEEGDFSIDADYTFNTPKKSTEATKKILKDIEVRIRRIKEMIAKGVGGNKFVLESKIANLEEDANKIRSEQDDIVPILIEQANEDLKSIAEFVGNSKDKSWAEINEAMMTMGVWKNIVETLGLGEDPTDDLQSIVNEATKLYKSLERISKQMFESEGVKDSIDLESMTNMKDDSWRKSFTLDLSASVNKFLQHIFKFVNNAALRRNEELQDKLSELKAITKGLSQEDISKLYQRDSKGNILYNSFVNRLSNQWWDTLKYYSGLSKKAITAEEKKEIRKFLNKNQVVLDPSIFMKEADGSYSVQGPRRESIIRKFIEELGDEEYAKYLITQGERKYQRFLKEQKDFQEYAQALFADAPLNEKAKLIHDAEVEWEAKNNPLIYYMYYYDTQFRPDLHSIYGEHINPQRSANIVTAPKRFVDGVKTNWYDSQFDVIQQNPKLKALYDFVNREMKEGKKYLPSYALKDNQSNYIFRAKATAANVLRTDGSLAFLNKMMDGGKSWFATEFDDEYVDQVDPITGKPINKVPVTTLVNIDKKIAELENSIENSNLLNLTVEEVNSLRDQVARLKSEYSKDLVSSMEVFLTMATNYKWMSSVHDKALIAKTIVESANEITSEGPKKGLINSKSALEYYIDAMLHGRHKAIEGQSGAGVKYKDNIFSMVDYIPLVRSSKSKEADALSKRLTAMEDDVQKILDKLKSGIEIDGDEEFILNEFRQLEDKYKSLGGKRFTWSSVADSLIKFTQLKSIGFAPMSGLANISFGVVSNMIHASGREDFSEKQALAAFTIMLHSTKKYLTFGRTSTKLSTKIANTMDKLQVITEIIDAKYGNHTQKSKVDPYLWFRSTDFFMKGMSSVAVMMNHKLENGMSLWDALDEEGNLDPTKVSQDIIDKWTSEGKYDFSQKLIKINKTIHGNADSDSPVKGKQYAMGRLVSQFRLSWMAEGIEARFAEKYYNHTLGREIEGRYITTYHLISDFSKAFSSTSGGPLGRFKEALDIMSKRGLTPLEKANLRKTLADVVMLTSVYGLAVLIKSAGDDDDDGKIDNGLASWIFNLLYRTEQDIAFYTSPEVFTTFTGRLVPALSVYSDTVKALSVSQDYLAGERESDDLLKYWMKAFPVSRQVYNMNMYATKSLDQMQIK